VQARLWLAQDDLQYAEVPTNKTLEPAGSKEEYMLNHPEQSNSHASQSIEKQGFVNESKENTSIIRGGHKEA